MKIVTKTIVEWTDVFGIKRIDFIDSISAVGNNQHHVLVAGMFDGMSRKFFLEDLKKGHIATYFNINELKQKYPEEFI